MSRSPERKSPHLPSDLQNLTSEYLTPNQYFRAIGSREVKFNQKVYQKILANYEDTFPLELYENAHFDAIKIVREYPFCVDECPFENGAKVDPKFVAGLLINFLSQQDLQTYDEVQDLGLEDDFTDVLEDEIKRAVEHNIKLFKEEWREYDPGLSPKYLDLINSLSEIQQDNILSDAYQILRDSDPEVYDTTERKAYMNKLIPILEELLEK